MAYYDALIAAWNGATQPPTGVVAGTPITGGITSAQKMAAVNTWKVTGAAVPMIIPPAKILNACTVTDLQLLTINQLALLQLLLSGQEVDASSGTVVRATIIALFTGKPSLTSLAALAALYDTPQIPWWQSVGLTSPVSSGDLEATGLS